MTTPYLMLGCAVIVPTGGIALAWSATAQDSALATQAISGTATLTAGTYSPDGFINHCASKLRTSVYDAICAQAWFTTEPANAAAVPLKIGFAAAGLTAGIGTNPLRFVMSSTGGALHTGLATVWTVFSLVNTSNSSPWSWLGLAYPGETRSLAIVASGPDDAGRMQPRWLYVLKASFQDTGDLITFPNQYAYNLGAGRVVAGGSGDPHQDRSIRLVTQTQAMIGPPWQIGRWSAFNNATTARHILTPVTQDETLFTGISSTNIDSTNLTSPVYLRSGQWFARYRDTSSSELRCFDIWPTSITPTVGMPIEAISEGYALLYEWRRTGLLFRYSPKDTDGTTTFTWRAYAPNATGDWKVQCDRVGGGLYYTLELPCKLVEDPQLSVP